MPSFTENSGSTSFQIPTIDISPFITSPASLKAGKVIQAIQLACRSTGFFQITGHGVPESVQEQALDASKRFFSMPLEDKETLNIKLNPGFRGYDPLCTQTYGPDALPDLKESFFVGHDIPLDDVRVKARRLLTGPNVWPSGLPASSFKDSIETYYNALHDLTLRILEMIALGLPYGADVFSNFISNSPAAPMRLLHYPPQEIDDDKRQLGASAHTDFGAITLLLQDKNEGLQVHDVQTDSWMTVPPRKDAFVVNVGDMLEKWTAGDLKSSLHRVLNQGGRDRYSIAFFFDGNLDCTLSPLDGTRVEGEPLTVEKHMIQCLSASYKETVE